MHEETYSYSRTSTLHLSGNAFTVLYGVFVTIPPSKSQFLTEFALAGILKKVVFAPIKHLVVFGLKLEALRCSGYSFISIPFV